MKTIAGLFTLMLIGVLALAGLTGGADAASAPSPVAFNEIPADLLPVYIEAARSCPGLPWQVLAAVGWVESRHAGGRADPQTGEVQPPIVGVALDGTNGTARIPDPNEPDGWAHAHGPMQFLRTTWEPWARLAPRRPPTAQPSPDNAWDAIHTAAAYLCGTAGEVTNIEQALLRYNHSTTYVQSVLAKAADYGAGSGIAIPPPVDGMFCPVAGVVSFTDDWGDPRSGGRRHQGTDLFAEHGAPLLAIEAGVIENGTDTDQGLGGITLWLRGQSGTLYLYAHNASNAVAIGTLATAGQVIAYVGDTGNAQGGAPHLHLQVHPNGGEPANPFALVSLLCRPPLGPWTLSPRCWAAAWSAERRRVE